MSYEDEYDRRRDEVKGGDRPSVRAIFHNYANDENYTAAGDRREHHPGRRIENYDPHEDEREEVGEPDYEAMQERRQERYRPDWA